VTSQQARQILLTYRPWVGDAPDPEVAAALALCRQDPELAKWFEQHCALQHAIRSGLQQSPLPEGLKEQIVSECRARSEIVWWRQPRLLAAAAIAAILLSVASLWFAVPQNRKEDLSLAGFRSRMVKTALRAYDMDLETNEVAQIRTYLTQHSAPGDYALPTKLERTETVGCGALSWQGKPVAMVCFRTGKPLAPGRKSDLFLFVIDRAALPQTAAIPAEAPEFATVGKLSTASWRAGDKVYVLAGFAEADVRERL
jgi:uncharacterized membrane protein YbaN (DUF454 family)